MLTNSYFDEKEKVKNYQEFFLQKNMPNITSLNPTLNKNICINNSNIKI